jgi:hypothetical protein
LRPAQVPAASAGRPIIDTFVPLPRRFKAGEHSHYLQHNGTTMAKILPRTEHSEDIRINVCVGIRNETSTGWPLSRTVFRDPLSEGFRHFVTSMPAPVAFRLERLPGGACTHWKAPPCHGAHPKPTSREDRVGVAPAHKKGRSPRL